MDEMIFFTEILIIIGSAIAAIVFFVKWYMHIFGSWPPKRAKCAKIVLGILPLVIFAAFLYVLRMLADEFVRNDIFYILMYLFLGFAWIYLGAFLMFLIFGIDWAQDAIHSDNRAALLTVSGGFLAIAAIYAGSNIGDGPGWWCVVFAGGAGTALWFVLIRFLDKMTNVLERINIGREKGTGLRLGAYMLGAGLILARGSSGDWTSFGMTIVEFADGWMIIPMTVLAVITEHIYISRKREGIDSGSWAISAFYLAAGAAALYMPSLFTK